MIGAEETVRVRYKNRKPEVEAERRATSRQSANAASKRAGVRGPTPSNQGRRLQTSKREQRERRQRAIRWKRIGLVAAIVACAVAVVWGLVALYRAPVFVVETISVEGGRHLSEADVIQLAKVPDDATLLRLSPSAIERRIERDPWVIDARVDRRFPHTVHITLSERRPAAVVDAGGTSLWVVSSDGYWLGERSAEESSVVVIRGMDELKPAVGTKVTQEEVLNATRIAVGLSPELRAITRAISAQSVDKTALITEDDVEIYVGEATQLVAKDRIAREILAREKGKVVYINVRVVDRPTWRGIESE